MYIHVCTDVSVRTNLFSLRFPGTCCTVSSVIVQEHCTSQKITVIVKCQGQRSLICYTLICIWSVYISFAILNKVNETEFVFSVNSLVYYKHVLLKLCLKFTRILFVSLSLFTSGSCCEVALSIIFINILYFVCCQDYTFGMGRGFVCLYCSPGTHWSKNTIHLQQS